MKAPFFIVFGRSGVRFLNSRMEILPQVSGNLLESLQANARTVNILEIGV
jgi:hypothetical protein